jgi:hypothetical protein
MQNIANIASSLATIPQEVTNLIGKTLVKASSFIPSSITGQVTSIYSSTIANTVSGTVITHGCKAALYIWKFTVLDIAVTQVLIGCGSLYALYKALSSIDLVCQGATKVIDTAGGIRTSLSKHITMAAAIKTTIYVVGALGVAAAAHHALAYGGVTAQLNAS